MIFLKNHWDKDEDNHANEDKDIAFFEVAEAINQKDEEQNQLSHTGKEYYGSLAMDKEIDNHEETTRSFKAHWGV